MRKVSMILITVLALSLFGLVKTKVYVQGLNSDIATMEQQKEALTEEVKVLMAEWSYLNKMERLESLSGKYLGLKKIDLTNIKTQNKDSETPLEVQATIKQVKYQEPFTKNSVNWRYKPRETLLKASVRNGKK